MARGQSVDSPCRVLFPKKFPFSPDPNQIYNPRCPTPQSKGRIAIVTDAGWDAVDAAASGTYVIAGRVDETCERSNGALTNEVAADGEAVWS